MGRSRSLRKARTSSSGAAQSMRPSSSAVRPSSDVIAVAISLPIPTSFRSHPTTTPYRGGMAGLSIGEVSRRTGLSVDALRFYEREGVLAGRVPRDGAGRRVYGDDDVAWLRICQTLR